MNRRPTLELVLPYTLWKRWVVAVELVFFILLLCLYLMVLLPPWWLGFLVAVQGLRVFTEMLNHRRLQQEFNIQDPWLIFPFHF